MRNITNETVESFRHYLIHEEKAQATVSKYVRDVCEFRRWLGERELTKEEVLAYKARLCEAYAPASVNAALSSLNSFFSFAEWFDLRVKSLKIMSYIHNGYAGRFQSVADYFQRSMDLLDPAVCADLFNDERPIRTKDMSNPSSYYGPESKVIRSLVSDGCTIEGEVENCVVSRGVVVEKGAKVANSILMQGTTVKAGASLNFVITDKDVLVNEDRSLMGHFNYPLAIAKDSVV